TITGPTGVYVLSQQSESWIRLRNAQRMRPRLTLEPVRWQRVRDTYTQVVTARVQQTPDTLQNARITVERLAADVLTAQQHLGELTGQEVSSAEEYLHQLDQLIARMQETLHAAHALDAAGWKALVADQEAVEQAWNRLIASTAPVTPAE
ncbi:MAG: hypothetical protein LC104_00585, partial [Bacteroidales bacterium]|nr:hypothetical protein [Bacteroidales bacterium]